VEPASYHSIQKVAAVLRDLPNPVRLEGHTDSVPIHTARFRNNWELSAARSIAMLNVLSDRFQLSAERFSVAGYADTRASGFQRHRGRAGRTTAASTSFVLNQMMKVPDVGPALATPNTPPEARRPPRRAK